MSLRFLLTYTCTFNISTYAVCADTHNNIKVNIFYLSHEEFMQTFERNVKQLT